MGKPKVAFYWLASCGGCEEAVIDLAEDLLTVVDAVEIVFWPVALDFKRSDVEGLEDGELAVAFVNGAVRTAEQEEMAFLLRRKAGLLVAFGSCAHLGGIPGLANFWDRKTIFERVYRTAPSVLNPDGVLPLEKCDVGEGELSLPAFFDTVKTLDRTVPVDYYLPGCAPPPDLILKAITAILEGSLPEKGAVLAPEKPLCDTCPRRDSKPERLDLEGFRRIHLVEINPEKCFLAEGVVCHGPATRSGCGERCINANMPCRGCFGPPSGVLDQGAKLLSALASSMGLGDGKEGLERFDSLPDPAGLLYMFGLPGSMLGRRRMEDESD